MTIDPYSPEEGTSQEYCVLVIDFHNQHMGTHKHRKAELVTGDKEFKQVEGEVKILWIAQFPGTVRGIIRRSRGFATEVNYPGHRPGRDILYTDESSFDANKYEEYDTREWKPSLVRPR